MTVDHTIGRKYSTIFRLYICILYIYIYIYIQHSYMHTVYVRFLQIYMSYANR